MKLFGNHNNTPLNTSLVFSELDQRFNPVTFKRSIRSKHIRISIGGDLKVKVTYPQRVAISRARDFFKSKIIWTQNTLIKLAKRQEIRLKNTSESTNILTKQEFLEKNQYLVKRCYDLAKKYDFKIKGVSLRRQKTIWGSCSSQNNVSLNSNLAFLRDELIDYVILHELTHTKIKNHSFKFWNEFSKILPNAKLLDRELRNYSPSFFKN